MAPFSSKPIKFKPRETARPGAKPLKKPSEDGPGLFGPLISTPVKKPHHAPVVDPETPKSPSPVKLERPGKAADLKKAEVKKVEVESTAGSSVLLASYRALLVVAVILWCAPHVVRFGVVELKVLGVGGEGRVGLSVVEGKYGMVPCRKGGSFKLRGGDGKCLANGKKEGTYKSKRCGGATCWNLEEQWLKSKGGEGELVLATLTVPSLGDMKIPIYNFEEAWEAVMRE